GLQAVVALREALDEGVVDRLLLYPGRVEAREMVVAGIVVAEDVDRPAVLGQPRERLHVGERPALVVDHRHAITRDAADRLAIGGRTRAVVDDRVHGERQAQRGGHIVLPRPAVRASVLVVDLPAPVLAEAAAQAGHRAPGFLHLVGPLLQLRIPDLAHGREAL